MDRREHRRVDEPAVGQRQEVEAVVDDVELGGALEHVRDVEAFRDLRVDVRILRVPTVDDGREPSRGHRVTGGEQGHVDSPRDQPLRQKRRELLPRAVVTRGNAPRDRRQHGHTEAVRAGRHAVAFWSRGAERLCGGSRRVAPHSRHSNGRPSGHLRHLDLSLAERDTPAKAHSARSLLCTVTTAQAQAARLVWPVSGRPSCRRVRTSQRRIVLSSPVACRIPDLVTEIGDSMRRARCEIYADGAGSTSGVAGWRSPDGSHWSQRGRYQFRSPSSFIVAGRSTPRTMRRVDQDRGREPDAELLEHQHRERREDREHGDHHDRGTRHDAGRALDPVRDRLVHARAAVVRLANPAEDEDVVVHRESEQDHEQEQRHDRLDPGRRAEAEQALREPCWKTITSTP